MGAFLTLKLLTMHPERLLSATLAGGGKPLPRDLRFLEELAATIDLGRQTGCPVEIYHLKAAGQRNWHKMPQALAMISAARDEGIDVTADMYPYVAGGTGLASALPPWAAADGKGVCNAEITFKVMEFPNDEFRDRMRDWAKRLQFPF